MSDYIDQLRALIPANVPTPGWGGDLGPDPGVEAPLGALTRDRSSILDDYNSQKTLSPDEARWMLGLKDYYKEGQFDPGAATATTDVWDQYNAQAEKDRAPSFMDKVTKAAALAAITYATGGIAGAAMGAPAAASLGAADSMAGLIPASDLGAGAIASALPEVASNPVSSYFDKVVQGFDPGKFAATTVKNMGGNALVNTALGKKVDFGDLLTNGLLTAGVNSAGVLPSTGWGSPVDAGLKSGAVNLIRTGDLGSAAQSALVAGGIQAVDDSTKGLQKTGNDKFDEITGGGTSKTQQGAIKDANDFWKNNPDKFAASETFGGDMRDVDVNADMSGLTVDSKGYAYDSNGDVKGFYYPDGTFQAVTYDEAGISTDDTGTVAYKDGTVIDADGNVLHQGTGVFPVTSGKLGGVSTDDTGVVQYPDGSVVNPDGTTFYSNSNDVRGVSTDDTGVRVLPDGTVVNPDGKVVNPKDESKKEGAISNVINNKTISMTSPQGKKLEFGEFTYPEQKQMEFAALMQQLARG